MAIKIINPIISEAVGGGGASFNIHYGLNPPEDTSMLWVETDVTPTSEMLNVHNPLKALALLPKTLPMPMDSMATAAVGKKVYMFGGCKNINATNKHSILNTILVYDVEQGSFTMLETVLPNTMNNIAIAVVGEKIYLFGGANNAKPTKGAYDTIYMFDTTTDTLTDKETVLPAATVLMSAATVGTKIYLFGGVTTNNSGTKTIYIYDTETDTLTPSSTEIPSSRCGMACATVGTKIYLLGGASTAYSINGGARNIYVYDTETDTISSINSLPEQRAYAGCSAVGNKIYLFGGTSTNSSYYSNIVCYDTEANTVTKEDATLQDAIDNIGVANVDDVLYLFGGRDCPSSWDARDTGYSFGPMTFAPKTSYVKASTTANVIPLVQGDISITLGVDGMFITDQDGKTTEVNAYLYNETSQAWELI